MEDNLLCSILGFLKTKSMSGYDIKKLSDQTIANFWNFNHSQIYPALKKLQESNCVDKKTEYVGSKARNIYSITTEGEHKLASWLQEPHMLEDKRIPFLLKIFFNDNESDTLFLHFNNYLKENNEKLLLLKKLQDHFQNNIDNIEHKYVKNWLTSVDFGIAMTEAKIKWLQNQMNNI